TDVLGLRAESPGGFAFPFVMLFLGPKPIAHLLRAGGPLDEFRGREARAYASGSEHRTGNLEHVAFNATGRTDLVARLERAGAPYRARTLADYGVAQLLFDGPDGIEIEVNFPLNE